MQTHSDIDINAAVRRVLVRHWIDLGRIQIRTCRGVATVSGHLERLSAGGPVLSPSTLEQIQHELRSIRGVRRVDLRVENWNCAPSGWQPSASV